MAEPQNEPPAAQTDPFGAAPSRIVVGYLRSPEGEAALSRAIAIAHRNDSHVTIVHAVTQAEATTEVDYYDQELAAIQRILENEGIVHTVRITTKGLSGAEAVLRAIADNDADLAIVGVRNRSRVGKALLGSDAQTVILEATCPVLVVKAPESSTTRGGPPS